MNILSEMYQFSVQERVHAQVQEELVAIIS